MDRATKRFVQRIERSAKRVRNGVIDGAGAAIGYAELAHMKFYRIKPYQARVSSALGRGSQLDAAGIAGLSRQGYRSIVNLRRESDGDEAPARASGLRYLKIPIIDNTKPSREQIQSFLSFVTAPANQPAYVHCAQGRGRTGVMVAAYRMAVEGWSAEAAIAEGRRFGMSLPKHLRLVRALGEDLASGRFPRYPSAVGAVVVSKGAE